MQIISLGAGVQSSTMALMAAHGEIKPMPDLAIFADTGAEPRKVMEWLDWLETMLPFPVYRVKHPGGTLTERTVGLHVSKKTGQTYMKSLIPAFVIRPNGSVSLAGRRCTGDHKIDPIMRQIRELVKPPRLAKDPMVNQWIGISTDEASRMKPAKFLWIRNVFPLIDAGMSRTNCLQWMKRQGYPEPPKSACTFCPFHDDAMWKTLKESSPEEFADVVAFERRMQASADQQTGTARFHGVPYLHRSGKPIDQVTFKDKPSARNLDMFLDECEGMCGV